MANNNLQRHERRDKSKWGVTFIAILLAFVAIAAAFVGIFSDGFTNWDKFKTDEEQQEQTSDGGAPVIDEEGEELESNTPVAMPMAMTFRSARSLDGANAAYDSVTLKATVEPINATDKRLDWSVSFVNPSDSWASGKMVTDYVTVTPTSDGADTATVQCLQDFGAKIKVTATSRAYSDKKADCTIDFAKRVEDISFSFQPSSGGSPVVVDASASSMTIPTMDCSLTVTPSFTYSDFTVEDTFTAEYTITETANVETMYSALDGVGGTAGSIALYGDDISLVGSGTSYSMEFGFLDNAVCNDGDPYYYGERPELFNAMFEWLRDNSSLPLFAFEFEATGTYSSVSGSINILFNSDSYTIAVSGVTLDQSNVII